MDRTGSGSCVLVFFGISGVELCVLLPVSSVKERR